jgi:hypothetical protein
MAAVLTGMIYRGTSTTYEILDFGVGLNCQSWDNFLCDGSTDQEARGGCDFAGKFNGVNPYCHINLVIKNVVVNHG